MIFNSDMSDSVAICMDFQGFNMELEFKEDSISNVVIKAYATSNSKWVTVADERVLRRFGSTFYDGSLNEDGVKVLKAIYTKLCSEYADGVRSIALSKLFEQVTKSLGLDLSANRTAE